MVIQAGSLSVPGCAQLDVTNIPIFCWMSGPVQGILHLLPYLILKPMRFKVEELKPRESLGFGLNHETILPPVITNCPPLPPPAASWCFDP